MLDANLLLDDTDAVVTALGRKGVVEATVLAARDALAERRGVLSELESMRAEMNRRSKQVGQLMAAKDPAAETERAALGDLKARIADQEGRNREADDAARHVMLALPNLPSPDAPDGEEADNVVLRHWGRAEDDFRLPGTTYQPHWEVAGALGIFDPERAAKLSGSGFALLYGDGARLIRALVAFALDLHGETYTEVLAPHIVRGALMEGTGHLPKFADDAYTIESDDLWLIPTGEVPLTGLHQDEILDPDELPKRYMTYSACFRREAGSAGKDTRGLQRVHEFHKVELVRICTPDTVRDEFDQLLADAEASLRKLELPYRVVDLAAGDLTFASSRIFDLEVYAPGVDTWLEVSSVGNFTDFQARRGNIRYRVPGGRTALVNTLNGSGLATPRVWAAIIEHGQRSDGTVEVPEALVPYLGKKVIEPQG